MNQLSIGVARQKKTTTLSIKRCRLLFLLVMILAMGGNVPVLAQDLFFISAKQKWVNTGIDLHQGDRMAISSRGSWTNGGANPQQVGPTGWPSVLLNSTLAPNLPLSSLIARVDNSVFLIGEDYKGASPVDGRLYLSMNDDDFSDNDGLVKVTVIVKPLIKAHGFERTPFSFITANQISTWFQLFFSGGRVQLSQTGEGNALDITSSNGVVTRSTSYISFGPTLNGFGIRDFALDLPDQEFTFDQIKNSGGFSVFGQYLLTHGLLFVDRFRFLVNNIHANFDNDLEFKLGNNEIILNLNLHSPDPAIRGEGNGFHPLFGLVPIPVGWRDDLCPDIAMTNMQVSIHLVPFIDGNQTLRLKDPTANVKAVPTLSVLDWLPVAEQIKSKALNDFEDQINKELKKETVKKGLESGLLGILPIFTGRPNENVKSFEIEPSGITITFNK